MKLLICTLLVLSQSALAFCGFYVSKADADLFNESSKVIIARDGERTILTMANDYKGDVEDFAMVVPVPTILTEGQIQVGDSAIIDRVDAYSAPRLVEYFDNDPCMMMQRFAAPAMGAAGAAGPQAPAGASALNRAQALGITIEESFSVGEYDILILSAKQSDGLEIWLNENNYRIPEGAADIFKSYIAQGMKFFVAKINLAAFESSGQVFLNPLMMAFETEKMVLPIQLGMINSNGFQDLIIYYLSPRGQAKTTNYRVAKIPANLDLPEYIENDFGNFYTSMFRKAIEREGSNVVMMEYGWDMNWCDPCAADPLSPDELRGAGVFWTADSSGPIGRNPIGPVPVRPPGSGAPMPPIQPMPPIPQIFGPTNVYLTRLHLRYNAKTHPEDLQFEVTDNRENFQGRYVLRRPFKGDLTCDAAKGYLANVAERQEREAQQLANITGWDIGEIRAEVSEYALDGEVPNWWERVFDRSN